MNIFSVRYLEFVAPKFFALSSFMHVFWICAHTHLSCQVHMSIKTYVSPYSQLLPGTNAFIIYICMYETTGNNVCLLSYTCDNSCFDRQHYKLSSHALNSFTHMMLFYSGKMNCILYTRGKLFIFENSILKGFLMN
jgi:hypothetical protein